MSVQSSSSSVSASCSGMVAEVGGGKKSSGLRASLGTPKTSITCRVTNWSFSSPWSLNIKSGSLVGDGGISSSWRRVHLVIFLPFLGIMAMVMGWRYVYQVAREQPLQLPDTPAQHHHYWCSYDNGMQWGCYSITLNGESCKTFPLINCNNLLYSQKLTGESFEIFKFRAIWRPPRWHARFGKAISNLGESKQVHGWIPGVLDVNGQRIGHFWASQPFLQPICQCVTQA